MKSRKPKNTNLDQNSTQKSSQTLICIVRKWPPKKVDKLITFEVAKLITLERPKGGQTNNSYIRYIYIYAVKLLSGPSLGVFGSYYLVQVGFLEVIIWSKFVFLAYKNSGFKKFVLHTQLSFCVFFLSPIFWQFSKNSLFQKKGAKIGFSNFQCFKFKF